MSDDKVIKLDDGSVIKFLDKSVEHYIDKTVVVIGPSGSGKSVMLKEIMYLLKDYVPNVIIISPTNFSNGTYSGVVPARCIKSDLTKRDIEAIYERQEAITRLYELANDQKIMASLFEKCGDTHAKSLEQKMINETQRMIDSVERSNLGAMEKISKQERYKKMCDTFTVKLRRDIIRNNMPILQAMDLTLEERTAIENLDINPKLMLICDDTSEQFKQWTKYFKGADDKNAFSRIFTMGRWIHITLIMAVHDETFVDARLRKNIRVMKYTTGQALLDAMKRGGYTAADKKRAELIVKKVFDSDTENPTHIKVCYVRFESDPFRCDLAKCYSRFRMGSDHLWELCERLQQETKGEEKNRLVRKWRQG
jgi:energy-coupling factor transporter ATP-binding protein EcfA2